jgi:small subunit ribosomal protein S4
MSRITDSKCKLCRREQTKLYLKGERCFTEKCALSRKQSLPGKTSFFHSRLSNYGVQLREKQKVKRVYGLNETQMKNLYKEASKSGGDKGAQLLQFLELRLDNVAYLLGVGASRANARQMVNHGKIVVNSKKVDIPSYRVSIGDKVELKDPSKKTPAPSYIQTPSWLKKSAKGGEVLSLPNRNMIDKDIKENLIVEFYSK